ncbi:MAG: type II toxin-antitoxin system mRNA interferase toxin, RelE/StbE family [Patescibacteria group bacterium]
MYKITYSKKAQKSLKRLYRSGNFDEVETALIVNRLAAGEILEARYRNHSLQGEYANCFECHVKSDLLLIYEIDKTEEMLTVVDMGSHSDLFR